MAPATANRLFRVARVSPAAEMSGVAVLLDAIKASKVVPSGFACFSFLLSCSCVFFAFVRCYRKLSPIFVVVVVFVSEIVIL